MIPVNPIGIDITFSALPVCHCMCHTGWNNEQADGSGGGSTYGCGWNCMPDNWDNCLANWTAAYTAGGGTV